MRSQHVYDWEAILPDDDGSFAPGSDNDGPRFVVEPTRRARVLTERLGVLQAFVVP